jgi:signal transduction histidine kinase
MAAPAPLALIGMRGGYWDARRSIDGRSAAQNSLTDDFVGLPAGWSAPLLTLLRQTAGQAGRLVSTQQLEAGALTLAAQPAGDAGIAWVAYAVPQPYYWHFWLIIVSLLAVATALLFTSAVWVVVTFNRSANALHRCLLGLAEDLSTPVPRPRIRELSAVADGIERLARRLAQARDEQERLGRELGQQERLAALGRVVAGVAHEVRNPLASIKLRLDLAAAGSRLPVAVEGAIGHASAEIARLDRLVADLLVVSGRQMGPRTATALEALVQARIEALTPWAATRGVSLRTTGQATAVIDAESVARAVDNLLRNAVEASPVESQVLVVCSSSASAVSVQIEDHGPGVPRSDELFEPFFTTKADGTGLGLAISRAIARAHGGDVTYQRRGFGGSAVTRFRLTLARRQPLLLEAAA